MSQQPKSFSVVFNYHLLPPISKYLCDLLPETSPVARRVYLEMFATMYIQDMSLGEVCDYFEVMADDFDQSIGQSDQTDMIKEHYVSECIETYAVYYLFFHNTISKVQEFLNQQHFQHVTSFLVGNDTMVLIFHYDEV